MKRFKRSSCQLPSLPLSWWNADRSSLALTRRHQPCPSRRALRAAARQN
ncbi:MAG TPA: hypothetical protein VFB73_05670 [Chloroflexota bacterium]|nr:hypothetical protein [Chloroflexota bacterium]